MGETPRDIPDQENFSTSAERREFSSAVHFDPMVEAAVDHMEIHADAIESQSTSPLDAVLDEYNNTLKLLTGEVDPATRATFEAQRDELREKISTTAAFDQTVEQELAGAVVREDSLHTRADILIEKHPLGEKQEPIDPSTPAAEMLRECLRVKLLAENLFLKTLDAVAELPVADQPKALGELDGLKIRLLGSTEELSSIKLDTRYPEEVSMDIWQSALTKLQSALEKILMTNREIADQVAKKSGEKEFPSTQGNLTERPSK